MTTILFIFYACLLIGTGVLAGIIIEQNISRKNASNRIYDDDFCWNCCKIHEEVYSNFKDPDDAWKELDDGNHCADCPLICAMDIIDEETLEKWRKKKKK